MDKPQINTFQEVIPYIYSWTTPDIPKYSGWEKIGYTEQVGGPDARIAQQASQLSVRKEKLWALRAFFQTERGGRFTDKDFHTFLKQQGVVREYNPDAKPKRTEWHNFANTPYTSKEYFLQFASQDAADLQRTGNEDYVLRPEQEAAVCQAKTAFDKGYHEVLWNAKPRFGKTLTTYELMQQINASKVLIITNRPAIANSWLDDFTRFIGHKTTYVFVSESPSLEGRETMTREDWTRHTIKNDDAKLVEFLSLQDLKGSQYFGGQYKKLKHVSEFEWDLLVIDEAHEGIDTLKTDVAFDNISRGKTLHLSGTPFKALASGKFTNQQIFNWTYEDEQVARQQWSDTSRDNPYASLPTLNLFTYQVSRMISDKLSEGAAIAEDEANIDYAFNLNEFFKTKENGTFEHKKDIENFLECLTQNEKYPFSTEELRNEIRHSFWLLDRVSSVKALEALLKKHEVFKDYTIIVAAGESKSQRGSDFVASEKSLGRAKRAIADAEKVGGKTITLSVGQLTTGVTIPEWTAVLMLSNLSSPAMYMQAAFRAQNPHTFVRAEQMLQKKNAYIFDFAPERTLVIFDEFANNLRPNLSGSTDERKDNIRRLLNFFPVIGEDNDGKMVELDASQVLSMPKLFKAKEVVRRGFLSNLLFDNVAGIFRHTNHVKEILEKLPEAKQGRIKHGNSIEIPDPGLSINGHGEAQVNLETVINPKIAELGAPIWSTEELPDTSTGKAPDELARKLADLVTQKTQATREKLKEEYNLTSRQIGRDIKLTEGKVQAAVERALTDKNIVQIHLEDQLETATSVQQIENLRQRQNETEFSFKSELIAILEETAQSVVEETVIREETKKSQKQANTVMDDTRSHLRGFARTIPLFLMAYGHKGVTLSNFDDHVPDEVFSEITGITKEEFRILRDGQEITVDDGTTVNVPGFFDESVFDQAIQEFLSKKEELSDYFDDSLRENIFAYIPAQKSSLVFTPQHVVNEMINLLENGDPKIFQDPTKTFADLFSTAGLFLMELVRRLDTGLAEKIPDQEERLKHILTNQLFELSHNQILHDITFEAVSGGIAKRKQWMQESGHFRVGNIVEMTHNEQNHLLNELLEKDAK